ncbi:MAG: lysylphosphatidylglycerol synthase transmembrane domain-containing protein [Anaerolineales bacterium]
MPFKIKKSPQAATILRWLGTILTIGLFIWLVSRQNWAVVLQKASGISPWAVLLALVFFFATYAFNTLRWCCLLWAQDVKITFLQAFRLAWAGVFASNFLFSTIGGDGFRMVGLLRYTGRKTVALGSLILDRVVNMIAMACLLPAPLLIFGHSLISGMAQPGIALALPAGLRKLFDRHFPKIATAFRVWASRPWAFVYAFLAAWPSNLFPMAATYLIARQLGMNVSFWQVIGVQTVTYFISQLLPSINGYGVRETAYTTLYAALGASLEQASTLALVTRVITTLATIPGALWLSRSVTDVALNDAELGDESGQP